MKFIHAADLHIDSPLRGLEAYDGAPLEQLRGATRVAFQNLIRLALDEAVDFLVIAGDLFDGRWQDMRTGLWTAAQFRELARAGIRVFLLQGNHDAANRMGSAITWPENVHVFSVRKAETIRIEGLQVALHGRGFAQETVVDDLAADYPEAIEGCFNIGVLHTSLSGSSDHDTYAPTSLATLINRGYDYWALGHIHARSEQPLSSDPYVAYCGNLQGRHIRETGPKGCLLVHVEDGELADVQFMATDTLRWHLVEVQLQATDGRAELLGTVARKLSEVRDTAEGRFSAIRLVIRGAAAVHRDVTKESQRAELVAEIRNLANDLADCLWVEKILFQTAAPIDVEALLHSQDLLGELLREMRRAGASGEALAELAGLFQPLRDKAGPELQEAGVELDDPRLLERWLSEAESLLVARLTELEP